MVKIKNLPTELKNSVIYNTIREQFDNEDEFLESEVPEQLSENFTHVISCKNDICEFYSIEIGVFILHLEILDYWGVYDIPEYIMEYIYDTDNTDKAIEELLKYDGGYKVFFKQVIENIIDLNDDIINLHTLYNLMIKYSYFKLIDKYRDLYLNNRIWEYQVSQNDQDIYPFIEENRVINAYFDLIYTIDNSLSTPNPFYICKKNLKWIFDLVKKDDYEDEDEDEISYQFKIIDYLVNNYLTKDMLNMKVKYDFAHVFKSYAKKNIPFTNYLNILSSNIDPISLFQYFIKILIKFDLFIDEYENIIYGIRSIITKMIEIGANPLDVLSYFDIEYVKNIRNFSFEYDTFDIQTKAYLIDILCKSSHEFKIKLKEKYDLDQIKGREFDDLFYENNMSGYDIYLSYLAYQYNNFKSSA